MHIRAEAATDAAAISRLIERAFLSKSLRAFGANGCVVLGDPRYYGRFGFQQVSGLVYPGPPPEDFMALWFAGEPPRGEVAYHAAFASEA
jgi:putative acetyltransferase